jgi:DNA-binding CsgD family transcriptional regulator
MRSRGLVESGVAESGQSPLVGRSEELTFCEALLSRRDGAGIVVTGAAGVGKTRLATEVLRAAKDVGYAVVRVTATEAGRAVPLGPFSHLLPADADSAATPLHLLRLARTALGAHADDRPLALLVDDAHLLDPASATLVQQLVASREATVVATVRTGEPVPDAVVGLWKDHGCEYLELQPLSVEETGSLVEGVVGGEVDGQTKHRLWQASRGLPLVVRELVLDGLERHLLSAHDGLWRWRGPLQARGRLLELIGARVGRLDSGDRAVLETVALGEPLSWSLLDAQEAAAAESLIRRGVLTVDQDRHRLELRLGHPLFGEFIRADMPSTRAAAMHRRLADALEATGMRRAGDVMRFAAWRLESGDTAPPELLLRAANIATSLFDFVPAERLAREAVEGGGNVPAERALARALTGQARFAEAEAILSRLASVVSTDEERTSVALARAHNLLLGFGHDAEAEAAVVEAAQLVSKPSLRRELELVRCWVMLRGGRPREAAAASCALVDEAGADVNFRLRAAGIAAHALADTGRCADALALVARLQPLVEQKADRSAVPKRSPILLAQFRSDRFVALLYLGRLREAEAAAHEAYARSLGDRFTAPTAMIALESGLVALVRGRLSSAQRWFREAVVLLREADPTASLPWAQALSARVLGEMGEAVAAGASIAAAEKSRRPGPWVYDPDLLLGRAWAAAAEGALTEAQHTAAAAADLAEERGALTSAFLAAHELVRLGDPAAAAPRLARLAGEVQGFLVAACAGHAQALVAGDASGIEGAASAFAELGALLWAAEAESAAASAHRDAGRDASARAAAARAALLLESCAEARTPALAAAGPVEELTPREREIAALAAGGASNREIAARLVVSVRTVENHLQRAYRKLGIGSRRELPGLLERATIE